MGAKQQVSMERMCRNQRLEVMQEEDRGNISQDQLDRAHALVMGNDAGPVMSGMMCGYMDVPVKALMAMRDDQDLLNLRADMLFKGRDADAKITQEEFGRGYNSFFDNALNVLADDGASGNGCSVQ